MFAQQLPMNWHMAMLTDRVVITTTIDSWVGRRTALHIAAAIPSEALLASGLMTGSWLETPLAPDPMVQAGHVAVPSGPGLDLGSWSRP